MILRGFTASYRRLPLSGVFSFETLSRLLTDGHRADVPGGRSDRRTAGRRAAPAPTSCSGCSPGSPGLNVFSLAFPLKILLTIGVAGTAVVLLPRDHGLIDRAVRAMLTRSGG